MKQLYLDIKARIELKVPEIKFIDMWNSQADQLEGAQSRIKEGGHDGGAEFYPFQTPAVFIEFVNPNPPKQLGNGARIFDPLIVRLHILHQLFDAGDGTKELNLLVFDLKQKLYKYLARFEPAQSVAMFTSGESQDYTHTNIYHYIQEYTTNWIDFDNEKPVDGITKAPPTQGDIVLTVQNTTDPNDPYTIPIQ